MCTYKYTYLDKCIRISSFSHQARFHTPPLADPYPEVMARLLPGLLPDLPKLIKARTDNHISQSSILIPQAMSESECVSEGRSSSGVRANELVWASTTPHELETSSSRPANSTYIVPLGVGGRNLLKSLIMKRIMSIEIR